MKNYIEPYAKENSLLQLSLFYFGKGRSERTSVEWIDNSGGKCQLECICKYGVPGSFDQDCYTGTMRIWVKQGMPKEGIKLNYSDIARELHLDPKDWVTRIKKSLKKLAQARYEFTRCFIDAESKKCEENVHFSLFDSASLFEYEQGKSKRKSESYLIFPDEIQKNLEAKYYQLLDMGWYRALPEGLARRLYEYLSKRRYHNVNGKFTISEQALCRWLPIVDKNVTTRRKRLKKIAQALIDAGYLCDYEFNNKKKHCIFSYAEQNKSKEKNVVENSQEGEKKVPEEIEKTIQQKEELLEEEIVSPQVKTTYLEALKWLESLPYFHQKRKDEIAQENMKEIANCYPGIRQAYEQQSNSGKRPGPGWVYNAFKEKWSFPSATEPRLPETPKGKWCKAAKELFDSWSEQKQKEFWKSLRLFVGTCVTDEQFNSLTETGKMWGFWAPKFMEVQELIELEPR